LVTLLLIDDDKDFTEFFVAAIEESGIRCQVLNQSKEILQYDLTGIDHIIIDLLMPDFDGLQILRFLKEIDYTGYISVTSGQDQSLLDAAREICQLHLLNFHSVLKKPFNLSCLDSLITDHVQGDIRVEKTKQLVKSDTELLEQLKLAIESQTLDVYFQPKIAIESSEVQGFEALARWNLDGVFIPPIEFICLAERSGLISELTEVIVEKSLRYFCQFKHLLAHPNLSINFSALELGQSNLPDLLISKIEQYNLASEQITLEITETVMLPKNTLSLEVLARLRLMGFKLSIDDFGAGYSSVNMLQNGPFTELKIDRAFISALDKNEQSRIIVSSIVQMAKKLNLIIVAEGIEQQTIVDELIKINCTIGQGYFYSRPMPVHDVIIWLESRLTNN
jgi:EAL domain-containing protein (putative c-di-GMP-specific phosphodiesterase class I)